MKRRFTILTAALALLAFLALPMGMKGQTRAEVLTYTLDGTITVTGNAYASPTELTQDGITWMVTGNTEQSPWRIGGKNISSVDRPVYSQTAISDNISKIEVTHGTANNITVNSWTVIVATDASFTDVVSTLTPTFAANATTTINRPTGADWSNCYYKFVYNISVSGNTNRFVQFSKADFYKQEGTGPVIATPIFSPVGGEYATTQNVTISCETQGSTIYYTTDGSTPDNTSTQYTAAIPVSSTTTINAIAYVGTDASSVATATYSIVQPLATMQAIFDKATEVGTTATYVYITLDDWVVSGVSTNGKNVFVTDGTKGFVIFDNSANMGFNAGDVLSGTVYCKVQLYNGFAELTLLNATTSGLSITSGGTVTAANVTMANLSGINTGALVHYENLTCSVDGNKYYLTDGTTTLQVYNAIYAFGSTFVADHVYNITGVYQQYNTTKEILPRSAEDIEEVVIAEPSIIIEPDTLNVDAEQHLVNYLSLTYENIVVENAQSFTVHYYDAEGEEIQPVQGETWMIAGVVKPEDTYQVLCTIMANESDARTAYFKVSAQDAEDNTVYSNLVTINQAEYIEPEHTITIDPDLIEMVAEGGEGGFEYTVSWSNGGWAEEFEFYDADGETIDQPDWITIVLQVGENEDYHYTIAANEGEARTTYFKAWTYDDNNVTKVYSNLVTVNQDGYMVPPTPGINYVRITSLDQLTNGSQVIIAARHDEENTNVYYAMTAATSGRPTGVEFTSEFSGNDEILPSDITSTEDTFYWIVTVDNDSYIFANADSQMIGYRTGTNFASNNSTQWTITRETAAETAMVAEYTGFVITNANSTGRAFAFNGEAFGAYAKSNMSASGYNFYLDFFVLTAAVEPETYTLTIEGYEDDENEGGYYLIASPVTVDLTDHEMTTGDFDLYYFDQSQDKEWINYEGANGNFNLEPGKGYLYAHKIGGEFTLSGTSYDGDGVIDLVYDTEATDFVGWNLVGNPWGEKAYPDRDFYTMNNDGTGIDVTVHEAGTEVNPMTGIFVVADDEGETVTFETGNSGEKSANLTLNVNKNNSLVDRAIVRFGNSNTLRKFQIFENSTKLYIAQNGEDFAIVNAEAQDEMPVSFRAKENGTYTFSVNTENVEMDYLHLIDNMTGADVDLLQTPSYSFEANVTDYTSRFRLVFSANTENDNNEHFAFFNNGELFITNTGNATINVIDMLGRTISSQVINDSESIRINANAGVYMLQLVNGDNMKTQKIVVK